jgi:hypothetical protein
MFFPRLIGLVAAFPILAAAVDLTGYEYVVVGSGAGGGVSQSILGWIESSLTYYSLWPPALPSLVTRPFSSKPVTTRAQTPTTPFPLSARGPRKTPT